MGKAVLPHAVAVTVQGPGVGAGVRLHALDAPGPVGQGAERLLVVDPLQPQLHQLLDLAHQGTGRRIAAGGGNGQELLPLAPVHRGMGDQVQLTLVLFPLDPEQGAEINGHGLDHANGLLRQQPDMQGVPAGEIMVFREAVRGLQGFRQPVALIVQADLVRLHYSSTNLFSGLSSIT